MSTQDSSIGWKNQSGFVWSLLGSAVGFANILSFSSHCYRNGGGAFLIPYMVALFILGIPLLLFEASIGKKWNLPLISAYAKRAGQAGKICGWIAVFACITIGCYYVVLTGYSVMYTGYALFGGIPENTKDFFEQSVLHLSSGIDDIGTFAPLSALATGLVIGVSWFIQSKNIQDGVEKICSIFMPILVVFIIIFTLVAFFLPQSSEGWARYLTPDFSKIVSLSLWRDVFGQLLFSLSLGLGIVVGYSRHSGNNISLTSAIVSVAFGDFFVSFIAGGCIFSFLAFLSKEQGIPFDSLVVNSGTFELGFVIFPKIIQLFGSWTQVIETSFFFCLFIAGITGVFSIVESIAGNFEIEFALTRRASVLRALGIISIGALFFCMGNGFFLIEALVPMVMGINMLFGTLALIICFAHFKSSLIAESCWQETPFAKFCKFCIQQVLPVVLIFLLIGNILDEYGAEKYSLIIRWGWFFIVVTLSFIFSKKEVDYGFCNHL